MIYQSEGRKGMESGGAFPIPLQNAPLEEAALRCQGPEATFAQAEILAEQHEPNWLVRYVRYSENGTHLIWVRRHQPEAACTYPVTETPENLSLYQKQSEALLKLIEADNP